MKKGLLISLAIYLIAGSIIGGILIGKSIVAPEIFTERITTETIRYEKLPQETIYRYFNVPVVNDVYIPIDLKIFSSTEELDILLEGYSGSKELTLRNMLLNGEFDCDDYAYSLRDYSRAKGYDIETEAFSKGEWDGKITRDSAHLACKTIIGNDILIINPVTLEYWIRWRID